MAEGWAQACSSAAQSKVHLPSTNAIGTLSKPRSESAGALRKGGYTGNVLTTDWPGAQPMRMAPWMPGTSEVRKVMASGPTSQPWRWRRCLTMAAKARSRCAGYP